MTTTHDERVHLMILKNCLNSMF